MNKFLLLFLFGFISQAVFSTEFFYDNFESGNLSTKGDNGSGWVGINRGSSDGDSVGISSEKAHSGLNSVKFHFGGNSNLKDDAWAELRYSLNGVKGLGYQEYYVRYYIYYPKSYYIRNAEGSDNNKVTTTWGEDYKDRAKFNVEMNPGNSVAFKIPSKAQYPYDEPVCSGPISRGMSADKHQSWKMDSSYLSRWVSWEFHFKLDDGSGNGGYDLWIDGNRKIHAQDLAFVGAPCAPGHIRHGYLLGWANSGFDQDTAVYIDDVVFSDSYIGPLESNPGVSPGAVKNLKLDRK